MTVTKRTARQALSQLFPRADLTARKDDINRYVDQILQGHL